MVRKTTIWRIYCDVNETTLYPGRARTSGGRAPVRIYGGEQKPRPYHVRRNANWISRGSPGPPEPWPAMGCTVLPITPKLGLLTSALGRLKLARLKILNISARNWRVFDSRNLKLRISEKSQSARPGPVKIFRPAFPKV